ncbi:hypothetical protein ES703_62707 [subsurface metagenome]
MQWLIDIIKEWIVAEGYALESWVLAKGYLTHSFVDRGDPVGPDWQLVSFTVDGTWRDLDLSSIVPAGAKAVLFNLGMISGSMSSFFELRKKTNANNIVRTFSNVQVASVVQGYDLVTACSDARIVQYKATSPGFLALELVVKGWWL